MPLTLDHLAVACTDLAEGTAWVEAELGVKMQPGGKHLRYGTHNTLLGLADGLYFEVIAVDPDAPPVSEARWFGLDTFSGPPRLANWICSTPDLAATLGAVPASVGIARNMQRGDLTWQITVPDDGTLPYAGAYPTLIEWPDNVHPSKSLPDSGCRLELLTISHPDAEAIAAMIDLPDPRVQFLAGPPGFTAKFDTQDGARYLC